MSYSDLTEGERAHWDEYETLRQITDWPGFDEAQDIRKHDARDWLVAKRKDIWRLAQPKSEGGDGQGWDHANRRERYEFLKDDNLNSGAPKHEVRLPAPGSCTDTEKVYIEEQGQGIYRGYTTDPSKVHAGDHAFISDDHTGVIYDRDTGQTVEGNTSASGGSQWNGGQVAKKTRGWGYWTGFGLVRYPE
jgi:hypothetical protein